MTMHDEGARSRQVSGWAIGGTVFAGVIMLLVGLFHAVAGLVALIDDEFYVVAENYTFEFDVTAWGWIHLIGGLLVASGGIAVFSGATWARILGITLAVVSAVINFFFLPYYPWWSLLMIGLAVWVIWSLSRPLEPVAD
jgi:hypothetical protein